MAMNILPNEMLHAVFTNCSSEDLKSVSKVCRRWAEAVEPLLLRNIRLKVSCLSINQQTLMDKQTLLASKRRYSSLRVDWSWEQTDRDALMLVELLDVCQKRFHRVERLILTAPPDDRLVGFFEDRQDWLQDLVELEVGIGPLPVTQTAGCEILLPKLKLLSWYEPHPKLFPRNTGRPFVLDAPELCELKLQLSKMRRDDYQHELPLLCFLEPKIFPKLETLEISELDQLSQSRADKFEPLLRNVKVLKFFNCVNDARNLICEKCPNLKELSIVGLTLSTIAPILSANLECLTLQHMNFEPATVEFQKLQRLFLFNVYIEEQTSLVAPQLSTFVAILAIDRNVNKLNVTHKDQIKTMKLEINDWTTLPVPPPPNVTELHLQLNVSDFQRTVQPYLCQFANLKQLTLKQPEFYWVPITCTFIEHHPKLEAFSGYQLIMQLKDCEKFSRLKSLILSNCVIKSEEPNGVEEVQLTALEYFRVEQVTVYGAKGGRFPMRANERQAPIEPVVCRGGPTTAGGGTQTVFSSRDFKAPTRFEPEYEFLVPD